MLSLVQPNTYLGSLVGCDDDVYAGALKKHSVTRKRPRDNENTVTSIGLYRAPKVVTSADDSQGLQQSRAGGAPQLPEKGYVFQSLSRMALMSIFRNNGGGAFLTEIIFRDYQESSKIIQAMMGELQSSDSGDQNPIRITLEQIGYLSYLETKIDSSSSELNLSCSN